MAYLMRRVRGGSSAFTLIELLVVVAIIGVLISILLPSLKGARDQAKQLLCITHLRSIGQASSFYADEYNDWVIANESQEGFIPRPGLPAGYPRDDSYAHTQFAISLLNGLLYDHAIHGLYNSRNQAGMLEVCREIPQFQCPTHPVPEQALDYVVNAFVQPYTQRNANGDRGQMQRGPDSRTRGQGVLDIAFFHRINSLRVSPARLIYITEGHATMPTNHLIYHDVFYGSQLPFSALPRVANDRRHPGGLNNVFFDGHVESMSFPRMDAGWPKSLGIRLRWFTTAPEAEW
ncbi:MAG: type II secretion system protein [Planctomycetes bacterium]|nr:type II secretion system protein [Planctomycetota bacterium]